MLTEKQMKMKLSELTREKMNEGLFLSFSNITSSDYKTMAILEDEAGNKYGLGLKIICSNSYPELDKAIIQFGKLKQHTFFDFEDEENATVEKFCLCNGRYFDEEESKELAEKRAYRLKFRPHRTIYNFFTVKSLNIPGLKRTKAKIEILRRKFGYIIFKDDKEVKRVYFK